MLLSQDLEKKLKNFKGLFLPELVQLLEDTQKEAKRLQLESKDTAINNERERIQLETYIKELHAYIVEIRLQTMPPQVKISDLEDPENGLLLSEKSLAKLEEYQNNPKVEKNAKLNRKNTGLLYSAIPDQQKGYHILFRGKNFKIGSGSYGDVKASQHAITGEWYASKISKKEPGHGYGNLPITDIQERFENERVRLTQFGQLKDWHVEIKNNIRKNYLFETYIPGQELFKFFSQLRSNTTECSVLKFLKICSLMAKELKTKCHDLDVVHRDVKPDNFICNIINDKIFGEKIVVTLIDYAFSVSLPPGEQVVSAKVAGALTYLEPKLLGKFEGPCSKATDIYALGVSFYEFGLGIKKIKDPLLETVPHLHSTFRGIVETTYYRNDKILNSFSEKYSESLSIQRDFESEYCVATKPVQAVITLILHMTDPDSKKRPDINDIIKKLDGLIQLQKQCQRRHPHYQIRKGRKIPNFSK